MEQKQLSLTSDVLLELAALFRDIQEEEAAIADNVLTRAALYVTQLQYHLARGDELHDAVRSTARG